MAAGALPNGFTGNVMLYLGALLTVLRLRDREVR